jgi:hypothetical protein
MFDDDWEPTVEDDIRMNSDLSPVQKQLLLKQSRIKTWRTAFVIILVLVFATAVGFLFHGWLRQLVIVAVLWGSVITHTVLQDAETRIQGQLRDQLEKQREAKRESRRQARLRKSQGRGSFL